MVKQAVILAGGLGTRLGALTKTTPKPMVLVDGIPFVQYVIGNLKRHGITDILLSIGYLADAFVEYFGDGSKFGVTIEYSIETEPMGTGGALVYCKDKLQSQFLVLNGDTMFDINFLDFGLLSKNKGMLGALALRKVEDTSRYGAITLKNDVIVTFAEKSASGPGLINGGIYLLNKSILDGLQLKPCSIESDLFPTLLENKSLYGCDYDGFFIDIGLPETLADAQTSIPKSQKKPCYIIDLEILVQSSDFNLPEPKIDWQASSLEKIKKANDKGIFVVINVDPEEKGLGSKEQIEAYLVEMAEQLKNQGAHFDYQYIGKSSPEEIGLALPMDTPKVTFISENKAVVKRWKGFGVATVEIFNFLDEITPEIS